MINSPKQNRSSLRSANKEPLKLDSIKPHKSDHWTDPVQLTEEEKKQLFQKIQRDAQLAKRRELIVVLFGLIIASVIIISITVYYQ